MVKHGEVNFAEIKRETIKFLYMYKKQKHNKNKSPFHTMSLYNVILITPVPSGIGNYIHCLVTKNKIIRFVLKMVSCRF